MLPASLLAAVGLTLPGPYEIDRAETLIRGREIAVPADQLRPVDRLAILAVAARLEILAPGDWMPLAGFGAEADAATVLECVRALGADLDDAPPLADAAILPPPSHCHEAASLNREIAATYRDRMAWEAWRADDLAAAATAADAYAEFWATAGWAASPHVSAYDRRLGLARCRDAIGRAAWDRGDLPAVAPPGALWPAR